jgi:hypothetical protein
VKRSTAELSAAGSGAYLARRPGPVQLIDDALLVLRRASWAQLSRGWLASWPCAAVALLFYYCERVEGLRTPRVGLAALFVLVFWLRFHILAGLSREFVSALRPSLPLAEASRSFARLACSASISALGLWLWGWPLLGLGRLSIFAVLALLPLLALRGAVAPSYLARAGCGEERGWAAFARALEDTRGARAVMLTLELLLAGGFVLLFGNLYAFGALILLLGSSVLGLDVSFVSAFLAPDNELVPLLLLGLTLMLLDPLRAALAALAFSEARGRNEGADLHAAIDALVRERSTRSSERAAKLGSALSLGLLLCSAAGVCQGRVVAQGGEVVASAEQADVAVRQRAQHILARSEFHEFDADTSEGARLLELFSRWLGSKNDAEPRRTSSARFELRVPAWAVVLCSIVLLAIVAVYLGAQARRAAASPPPTAASPTTSVSVAPRAKPADLLADAAALAHAGQHRDAVRVLYAASLAALDRLGVIRFETSRTNGHYVRVLSQGATRDRLGALTEAFDHSWYGHALVTQADYERAKQWADALCSAAERQS